MNTWFIQNGLYFQCHRIWNGVYIRRIKNIRTVCDELGLYLMMDGARLGVALSTVDYTLNDLANICDVFYIGGTKMEL